MLDIANDSCIEQVLHRDCFRGVDASGIDKELQLANIQLVESLSKSDMQISTHKLLRAYIVLLPEPDNAKNSSTLI